MASIFADQDRIMKKIVLVFIALLIIPVAFSQKTKQKKDFSKVLSRPGDHIMLQLSSDHWQGAPDSISSRIKGLSRGANIYVMVDKPFKSNPRLSVAFGIGVGTSSIFFDNETVGLTAATSFLPFNKVDTVYHFKKYKLATSYLEVPVELRFSSDPENDGKSIKGALGIKVGTLLNVHTKGKTLLNSSGTTVNSYTEKVNSKHFFNSTRLMATARIGYGHYSLFGNLQLNGIFNAGVAADTRLLQIGLCISGL